LSHPGPFKKGQTTQWQTEKRQMTNNVDSDYPFGIFKLFLRYIDDVLSINHQKNIIKPEI
jgi:hypothetical protein